MSYLVFDTNILIDYLRGNFDALAVIDACPHPVISKITYMEVMVGCKYSISDAEAVDYDNALATIEDRTRHWIQSTFSVMPIDDLVADFSIEVRKQTHKKLPDTVIHATAILNAWDIITRNPADFIPLLKVPNGYQNITAIVPYSVEGGAYISSP